MYLFLLVYFFILATCVFPFEYFSFSLFIVSWLFFFPFFFLSFLFSVFGYIIPFMTVLLFLQCVCPNTSSSFFAASLLSPGALKGLKFSRRLLLDGSGGAEMLRSGQACHAGGRSLHSKASTSRRGGSGRG